MFKSFVNSNECLIALSKLNFELLEIIKKLVKVINQFKVQKKHLNLLKTKVQFIFDLCENNNAGKILLKNLKNKIVNYK